MPTDPNEKGRHPGTYDAPSGDSGSYPQSGPESPSLGYETTDVNVGGIIVFLAGLSGFILIFFVFCFVMGKVINAAFVKEDGPATKWNHNYSDAGMKTTDTGKRQNLASNPEMQQRELQTVSNAFPNPRLQTDDGNQATADLHAREDLLLDHYSVSPSEGGLIRIPIDRAMELIAQRGLPAAPSPSSAGPLFAGDANPSVTMPLTSGFARTGYELDVIEAREQKLSYGRAESAEHAELKSAH